MERTFIKLGFIGSYKADLIYYLSEVLRSINKDVLVVDGSREQYIEPVLLGDSYNESFNYNNIDFLIKKETRQGFNNIDYSDYDIALIDFGTNKDLCNFYGEVDILFLVTDFEKHNILAIKDILDRLPSKTRLIKIYRDVIDSKINEKYVDYFLNIEEKIKPLGKYIFEFKEEDYKWRLSYQYDNKINFKYLSKEYKELIFDIVEEVYGIKPREILRAVKLSKGGRGCK